MKKLTSIFSLALAIVMIASMCVVGTSAAAGDTDTWDGTTDTTWYDPTKTVFEIKSAEQLAGVAELLEMGLTFEGIELRLTTDIALNEGDSANWDLVAPANVWKPIGSKANPFRGIFDGQGHTVSGLYIYGPGDENFQYQGLFGFAGGEIEPTVIKNLNIVNSYIEVFAFAGLLAGRIGELTTIENVRVTGKSIAIEGYPSTSGPNAANSNNGGVIGRVDNAYDVIVSGCSFSGYVEGFVRCGTIVGSAGGTMLTVTDCYSDATIFARNRVGGIVGHTNTSLTEIINCSFTGEIRHSQYAANYGAIMGGLRGASSETIVTDCYYDATFKSLDKTTGEVTGDLLPRMGVSEQGVFSDECTWYTPMEDKSGEPSGNDEDGCEAEVTVKGAGAKDAFVATLDSAIWDTATLTLKPVTVNEQAIVVEPETTPAPETTVTPEETTVAPEDTTPVDTTPTDTTPTDTTPVDTTPVDTTPTDTTPTDTTPTDTTPTDTAPAEGGCGSFIGGGIVVATAILGTAWVSKRR